MISSPGFRQFAPSVLISSVLLSTAHLSIAWPDVAKVMLRVVVGGVLSPTCALYHLLWARIAPIGSRDRIRNDVFTAVTAYFARCTHFTSLHVLHNAYINIESERRPFKSLSSVARPTAETESRQNFHSTCAHSMHYYISLDILIMISSDVRIQCATRVRDEKRLL